MSNIKIRKDSIEDLDAIQELNNTILKNSNRNLSKNDFEV